jgi:hypothetical protein
MNHCTTVKIRTFLAPFVSVMALLPLTGCVSVSSEHPAPAPELLEAGDLIWPKPPGAIVPYRSQLGEATEHDSAQWEKEKKDYLAELDRKTNRTPEERERYKALEKMTYAEFVAIYLRDLPPGKAAASGLGGVLSVGHVGIIQIENGIPFVVEAMITPGVRRISYSDWVKERRGELIWLGRLKNTSAEKRTAVAAVAANYIGRPYNFWNFNLEDSRCFYCSKLAWLSIFTGAGYPPDDNSNPNRVLWYSPKQLMHSPHVQLIVNPGNYGLKRGDH